MAETFPEVVVAVTARGERRYRLVPELRAHIHDDGALELVSAAEASPAALPVYRPEAPGPPAAATGRLFVRFDPPLSGSSCEEVIARAGLTVVGAPPWAPGGAWVCDPDRHVARALAAIPRLVELPGIATVEPELLRARRGFPSGAP